MCIFTKQCGLKRNLKEHEPLFVVGLTEHQQKVNYRMSFRFLQYCVYIWDYYEKQQEALKKGSTELKDFKYPPVLPIVYYTGESKWTAPLNFYDKVYLNKIFKQYIPSFEYMLIEANNYTQDDLLKNKDILSLFFLIDKIKYAEQISQINKIPQEYFDELEKETPEHLRELIRDVVYFFLKRLDVPEEELDDFSSKIKNRRLSNMFELLDGYSVRRTREEARKEAREEAWEEAREEAQREFAINLFRENIDEKIISKSINLPLEKVLEIKRTLMAEAE